MTPKKKPTTAAKLPKACPVAGCRTQGPHTDDILVKQLVRQFAAPDKCLGWVQASLSELRDSMIDDYKSNRHMGWYTRMRQVEELYFRTLYLLFLAADQEIPHILSGDTPNSLTPIYKEVNSKIMNDRGELLKVKPGAQFGSFKPIDILHSGAHVGFRAMQTIVILAQARQPLDIDPLITHINRYIDRVNYMRQMFGAGRDKQIVRAAISRMHTS